MAEHFNGEGYSQQPLTPKETAEQRHFISEARKVWPTVVGGDDIAKGVKALGKVIAVVAALGVAIAWVVNMGVLP